MYRDFVRKRDLVLCEVGTDFLTQTTNSLCREGSVTTVAFFLLDPAAVRVRFVVYKVALRHDCRRILRFFPVSTIPARTSGRRLGTSKQTALDRKTLLQSNVYWTVHHCNSWGVKNQLDVTYLYFTYYLLNMFRTLICPSSGACDCVDGLHRLSCSVKADVFAISVPLWCVMVRLATWHITPNAPLHTIKVH